MTQFVTKTAPNISTLALLNARVSQNSTKENVQLVCVLKFTALSVAAMEKLMEMLVRPDARM